MSNRTRTAWIDIAWGISIILVVMMYSAYNIGEYTGETGFLHYVIGYATLFRMPEFFLISGLFLSRVIDRPWKRYGDRRAVHYFYFYGLWASIMIALKVGIYGAAPAEMAQDMVEAVFQPYGLLWFIYMLGVFGLAAKLLRQSGVPHWVVLAAAAFLQMAQVEASSYVLQQFASYFVFFYGGYVFAPYIFRLAGWAQGNKLRAAAMLAAWALANGFLVFLPEYAVLPTHTQMGYAAFPPLHLALAVAGALALCVSSALISGFRSAEWLRWLGEHSLVVYLAFTIPMSLFRAFALWSGMMTQTGSLSFAVLVVSVAASVALFWMVRWSGFGAFLFERPAWARIADARHWGEAVVAGGRHLSVKTASANHRIADR